MTSFISRRTQLATLAVAAAVLSAFATTALAQTPSLADLAKKEQERRKAAGSATKVITDKDLPKPTTPATAATPVPLPAATPPGEEKKAEEKKAEGEAKDETYWRTRIVSAREQLRRAEMFAEALQSRINALSADFVNRDDPYQRAKIAEDRQKALSEMERVTADIEKAKKEVAGIEEEARQAGVPPGWLR